MGPLHFRRSPKESASAMDLDCKSTKLSKFLDEWTVNKDLQLQDNSLHMKLNIFTILKNKGKLIKTLE